MTEYLQLIGLTLIGGLISLSGGLLLLRNKKTANGLAKYATPFAAGALLSAVFLDLLKDGIETSSVDTVMFSALCGFLAFFLGERLLQWFHHHHGHEDEKRTAEKPLIIIGDTIHNALDGIAIAAAFMLNPATGLVTAIAVAAHEIPQEIGDFGLLLSRGMSRKKVLLVNIFSALASTLTAVLVLALGNSDVLPLGAILGVSAGFLLYIAASDIIPEIHENISKNKLMDWSVIMLLIGVVVVGLTIETAHKYIHTEHEHTELMINNQNDDVHSIDEKHYH